jgi:hypothetical protein
MSQIPPQGYPPGGYQPPGQVPGPYAQPGYGMQPVSSTSAAAVTSLICGLLGCVPFATGIVAVITGVVGISATKSPMKTGRGLAIAGLVLGILSIGGWGIYFGAIGIWWAKSAPLRTMGDQFITALGAGDTATASKLATTNVTADQISAAEDQLKGWGGIQQKMPVIAMPSIGGQPAPVTATITTKNGQVHQYMIRAVDDNGTWKVDSFTLQQ